MADQEPKNPAREQFEANQRALANGADASERMADAFSDTAKTLQKTIPSLEELAGETLKAVENMQGAADATTGFRDVFAEVVNHSVQFDKSILSAVPELKKAASDIGIGMLPTTFEKASDELAGWAVDVEHIAKQVNVFDHLKLTVKDIAERGKNWAGVFKDKKLLDTAQRLQLSFGKQKYSFESMLKSAIGIGKETDSWKNKSLFEKLTDKETSKTAMAAVGAGFIAEQAKAVFEALKSVLFAAWAYIDNFVLPTQVALNKELGGTRTALKGIGGQAMSMGHQFASLGMSFDQGVKDVTAIAKGLANVNLPKGVTKELVKYAEVTGAGAEAAAKLGDQFVHSDGSLKNFTAGMHDATRAANEYNIPVSMIQHEWSENTDQISRFGSQNYHAMNDAIARAHRYGLSLKEVNSAFGDSMDTFESTNTLAAKLNGTFGTTINSLELLQEQDPSKRMMMLSKSMEQAGVNFNTLDRSSQNLIKQLTNLDQSQAALVFSGEKGRKEFEKQAEKQKAAAQASDNWEKALGSMRSVLVNTTEEFGKLFMAISTVVAKFFGFDDATTGAIKTADGFKNFLQKLTNKVYEFANSMPKGKDDIFTRFDRFIVSLEKVAAGLQKVGDFAEKLTPKSHTDKFVDRFIELSKSTELTKDNMEEMQQMQDEMNNFPVQAKENYAALKARGINKSAADSVMKDLQTEVLANKLRTKGIMQGPLGAPTTMNEINIAIQQHRDGVKASASAQVKRAAQSGTTPIRRIQNTKVKT